MASVESVANEIIRQQDRLTTMKLQKLVFYANAIHLARHQEPLFDDQVEAFRDGPVVRALWERFRGLRLLNRASHEITDAPTLSGSAAVAVAEALELYGHQSADWLRFQTHAERPWVDGWAKQYPTEKVITNEEIIEFYESVFNDPEVEQAITTEPDEPPLSADDIRERYAEHLNA